MHESTTPLYILFYDYTLLFYISCQGFFNKEQFVMNQLY